MTAKWFEQDVAAPQQNDANPSRNWPVSLQVGDEVEVCFLNTGDVRIEPVHYFNVMHDGKLKRVLSTRAEHLGGHDPLYEYHLLQEEGTEGHWKSKEHQSLCYTVLINYGGEKGIKKCLRLSTPADHKNLERKRETYIKKKGKEGIHNIWFELLRPKDVEKPARIGILGEELRPLDTSEFDEGYLQPFTEAEILEQFVSDPDEMAAIYKEVEEKAESNGVQIREV